jgi:hypothetical protein
MFFGLPHDGSDGARLAATIVDIVKAVVHVNKTNLHHLKPESRTLQDISTHFSELDGIHIVTIFEANRTTVAPGRSILVNTLAFCHCTNSETLRSFREAPQF